MVHLALPAADLDGEARFDSKPARAGSRSIDRLIDGLLSEGGQRNRLEVKLFGGGNMVKGVSGIGHKNADFIERWMGDRKLPVASRHLRGHCARRIEYTPVTGRGRLMTITGDLTQKIHLEEWLAAQSRAPTTA